MADPRISVRFTPEDHLKFKILATKRKKSMQELIIEFVKKEIKKDEEKSNEKNT